MYFNSYFIKEYTRWTFLFILNPYPEFTFRNGKKLGFEFKLSEAPKITKSMRMIIQELKLDSFTVIYPGEVIYTLEDNISVIPVNKIKDYFSNLSNS
jgi:hypothetical protein